MKMYSWGRTTVSFPHIILNDVHFPLSNESHLSVGNQLSYGDSCLNHKGVIFQNSFNDSIISFNESQREIVVESGITIRELLLFLIPRGFFLPVIPGTLEVTLGGAIANDIHGKNHHQDGSFGNWVESFCLINSKGSFECSKNNNPELFFATIGGLGLTGHIETCRLKLDQIQSSFLDVEILKFKDLDQFFKINQESGQYKYTVAWIDSFTFSNRNKRLHGHFIRGNHSLEGGLVIKEKSKWLNIPFECPEFILNPYFVKVFNWLYFHRFLGKVKKIHQHYEDFFCPLDIIKNWNLIYGRRGLYQFQCVLPHENVSEALVKMLSLIVDSGQGSFLSVLKSFGSNTSGGLLSFPIEGVTIALDFANRGEKTRILLRELYALVDDYNGRVYPAKDCLLENAQFERMYPRHLEFKKQQDQLFSSNWWRRVKG